MGSRRLHGFFAINLSRKPARYRGVPSLSGQEALSHGQELHKTDEPPLVEQISNAVYALDATIIQVCLSLFPWTPDNRAQGGIKMHTQLDYPFQWRLIRLFETKTGEHFLFPTNNFELLGLTIATMYRSRWDIELFFLLVTGL